MKKALKYIRDPCSGCLMLVMVFLAEIILSEGDTSAEA
jgi:hypothetical protein